MAKSFHTDVSPYLNGAQSPIIDKKLWKWESLLATLAVMTILLPAAAGSNVMGLIGLTFLGLRRWKDRALLSHEIKTCLRILISAFAALWVTRVLLGIIEASGSGIQSFSPHLHLLGKQGFYGAFVILSFCVWGVLRPKNRSLVAGNVLLIFYFSVFLYALGQRYFGWDFVHGFTARLGENRFAYGVYRASGWMDHPLTLAYNTVLIGILSFTHARWLRQRQDSQAKIWFGISALCLGILILSQSRFPLSLAIALTALALLTDQKRYRVAIGLGTVALAALGFWLFLKSGPEGRWSELTDSSVSWEKRFDRLVFWKVHIRIFLDNIWTGTGLGGYKTQLLDTYAQAGYTGLERKYNAHNIYLQTLADSGLIGAAGLCIMLGALGRVAIRAKKRFGHSGLLFVFLATVLGGFVQNNLRDSEYLFALWTSIALALFWLSDQGKTDESASRDQLQDRQS